MMSFQVLETISGNILDAKEKYIVHSCNCVSQMAGGLAKDIFDRFPYSNIYENRVRESIPGTIHIAGDGVGDRFVVNMFSLFYPGSPRFPDSQKDGYIAREQYFCQCLDELANIPNLESVAFPYEISCGLGRGNWSNYLKMITDFADYINTNQGAKTVIYKLF